MGGYVELGLMNTDDAKNKGFSAAIDGIPLDGSWWIGGNPYNNWGDELPFYQSWRNGWQEAKSL